MIKIEFEGTDGAGKTTGLKYFIEKARSLGLNVIETREVGNPHIPVCVKLRELVLSKDSHLCGEAMELIFSAMRIENEKWLAGIAGGPTPPDLVVSDRGWFSHLSYTDHNVNATFTYDLYDNFLSEYTSLPNVVIYFDVDTSVALKRRVRRGETVDVIEQKGIEFQDAVRQSFAYHLRPTHTGVKLYQVDANYDLPMVKNQLDVIINLIITGLKK